MCVDPSNCDGGCSECSSDTGTPTNRERLIFEMATAARNHHYCAMGASGKLCTYCKEDGVCAEINHLKPITAWDDDDQDWDWCFSAKAALEVVERKLNIKIANDE